MPADEIPASSIQSEKQTPPPIPAFKPGEESDQRDYLSRAVDGMTDALRDDWEGFFKQRAKKPARKPERRNPFDQSNP